MKKIQLYCHCRLLAILLIASVTAIAHAGNSPRSIMFVGNSISEGVGATHPSKRYSTVAVDLLNRDAGKTLYREVNAAISGSTMVTYPWPHETASAYPYRLQDVLNIKPDILVLQHGGNDNSLGFSVAEFAAALRSFIREVKVALPQTRIVCLTSGPSFHGGSERVKWLNEANTAIQEIAACENTLLAQTNLALRNRQELFPDNIHPNDEGHRIMAETLVKTIQENRIMRKDAFDFVVQQPGTYRICGYVFQISKENIADDQYTCFYNIGKTGWSYSSFSNVKVTSPYMIYFSPMKGVLENGKELPFIYQAYYKNGIWQLPGTQGKLLKTTIKSILDK